MSERAKERERERERKYVCACFSLWSLTFSLVSVPCPFPSSLAGFHSPSKPRVSRTSSLLRRRERGTESHSRLADTPPDFPAKEKIVSGERCEGEGEKKVPSQLGSAPPASCIPQSAGCPGCVSRSSLATSDNDTENTYACTYLNTVSVQYVHVAPSAGSPCELPDCSSTWCCSERVWTMQKGGVGNRGFLFSGAAIEGITSHPSPVQRSFSISEK